MSDRSRPSSPNRAAASDPAGSAGTSTGASAGPAGDLRARAIGLRLARLHLRVGSLSLARAELEAYAGRSLLDDGALLDLAEARWRTGDLGGAGEAADAFLATGRSDLLALVVVAEATAALGRPGEARRLAARALSEAPGPLDSLFAGMPHSLIWPAEAVEAGAAGPAAEPGRGIADAAGELGVGQADLTGEGAARETGVPDAADGLAAPLLGSPARPSGAAALASGRLAAERGDWSGAVVRLGLALRLDPRLAHAVLEVIGQPAPDDAGVALLAGDALRLLGRESEALVAFERALSAADEAAGPGAPPGSGPALG